MYNGLVIVLVVIATCSLSLADEPSLSTKSEKEASLRAVIERLEARVSELEIQLQQMKQAQQQLILGSSLLEITPFLSAKELDSAGTMRVDKSGIIRDASGRGIGYWGFDLTPREGVSVPIPRR
jgi:hypothetical protein